MHKYDEPINRTGTPNKVCYYYNLYLALTSNKIIFINGAIERGSNPAPGRTGLHFHFVVVTKTRSSISAVRKAFPSCDVQPLRGSFEQAEEYLNGNKKDGFKEPLRRETRGNTPVERKGQGKNSHHGEEILAAIDEGMNLCDLERAFFTDFLRYGAAIRSLYMSLTQQKARKIALERYSNVEWRPWQKDCLSMIESEIEQPNPRVVHWFWEQRGAMGKSFLAGFLQLKYNALLLEAGKKADLAYTLANALSGSDVPIVVCDFVRTTQPSEELTSNGTTNNWFFNVYAFLESVKNGRVLSTKYESRTLILPKPPVVICFANWRPQTEVMSADRWHIVQIMPPLTPY